MSTARFLHAARIPMAVELLRHAVTCEDRVGALRRAHEWCNAMGGAAFDAHKVQDNPFDEDMCVTAAELWWRTGNEMFAVIWWEGLRK